MESSVGTIYTIGHSTRSLNEFVLILKKFGISALADIRSFPGSRRFPQFNKETLSVSLPVEGIRYTHFPALGGRRRPSANSRHHAWRNASFKGYADHMDSAEFSAAITELTEMAMTTPTAYMCSEAVWWRCHRALVSDYPKVRGWKVLHILSAEKAEEHPYTSPAKVVQGKLFYD